MTQNRGKMSPDDGQTLCMNGMHTNYYEYYAYYSIKSRSTLCLLWILLCILYAHT